MTAGGETVRVIKNGATKGTQELLSQIVDAIKEMLSFLSFYGPHRHYMGAICLSYPLNGADNAKTSNERPHHDKGKGQGMMLMMPCFTRWGVSVERNVRTWSRKWPLEEFSLIIIGIRVYGYHCHCLQRMCPVRL